MKRKIIITTLILLALSAALLYIRIERKPPSKTPKSVSTISASQEKRSSSAEKKKAMAEKKAKEETSKPLYEKSLIGRTFFSDEHKIEFINASQYIISVARSEGDGDLQVPFLYAIDGDEISITNESGYEEKDNFSFTRHSVTIGEATYVDTPNTKYWNKDGKDISVAPKKNYNEPEFDDLDEDTNKSKKKDNKDSSANSKKDRKENHGTKSTSTKKNNA